MTRDTLLTLLRIPFLGWIGSISYVLPIRQNIDILNRDIRVGERVGERVATSVSYIEMALDQRLGPLVGSSVTMDLFSILPDISNQWQVSFWVITW